jgi:hypothetical protein
MPLLVLAIAHIFFEYGLDSSKVGLDCVKQLFPSGNIDLFNETREIGVRFLWLASCIVLTVTSLAAILISLLTIFRCLPRRQCIVTTILALVGATGSVVLVTGIINMGAWMRWPAALFPPAYATEINGIALGVTTFWGATFTLTTVAAYLPAAVYVRMRAVEDFARINPDKTPAEQETWLKEHNLTISPGTQLVPIAAMIGPVIASPLSALLSNFLSQLPQ